MTAADATWDGGPLGALADVRPPVTFGFGSVPPRLARITTTVRLL